MTLKELFENVKISGSVTLNLVEEGVVYNSYDGYASITEDDCGETDGVPAAFIEYQNNEVSSIRAEHSTLWHHGKTTEVPKIACDIYAVPDDGRCEVMYTGGGIWCGICKTKDGWFFGETNSWGGLWKTYSQALEAFDGEDCGHIRWVSNYDELKAIWTHIYEEVIRRGDFPTDECKEWLKNIDKELEDALS